MYKHHQEGSFVRVVIDEWPWERVGVLEAVYVNGNIKVKTPTNVIVHRKDAEIISEEEYLDWKNRIKNKAKRR